MRETNSSSSKFYFPGLSSKINERVGSSAKEYLKNNSSCENLPRGEIYHASQMREASFRGVWGRGGYVRALHLRVTRDDSSGEFSASLLALIERQIKDNGWGG